MYNIPMVTVILPGGSLHNKEWLEETSQKINVEGEIRPIYWSHWTDPTKEFDKKEKSRLIDDIVGPRSVDIIAKSIGSLVAAYVIQRNPEKIRKVIINGLPLNDISEDERETIKSALKLVAPDSILCFQNVNDPHGSFDQVKKFWSEVNPRITPISKDRDDHEYPYFDEFHNFLLG
jgi:pimeloyl-ACP methyl ester carboxylesterase